MADSGPVIDFISQSDEFIEKSRDFYLPLDAETREIRLFMLQPGEINDPINIEIFTVSLDEDPIYWAISYTWGELSPTKAIFVEGLEYQVTLNQYAALQHFRQPDETEVLWMDVICIDQADEDEKCQQVALMGDIYRTNQQTRCWLGLTDDAHAYLEAALVENRKHRNSRAFRADREKCMMLLDNARSPDDDLLEMWSDAENHPIDGALAVLEMLASDIHFHEMPFWRRTQDQRIEFSETWVEAMTMLSAIFTAKWWKRAWITQEAVLTSAPAVIQIGTRFIPLPVVVKAFVGFDNHFGYGQCCEEYGITWGSGWLHMLYSTYQAAIEYLSSILEDYERGVVAPGKLVLLTKNRKATRMHDHVYSILPMWKLAGLDFEIPIDYTRPVADIYASVTHGMMEDSKTLDCLLGSRCLSGQTQLPSWVHDFALSDTEVDVGRKLADMLDEKLEAAEIEHSKRLYSLSKPSWDQQDNSLSVSLKVLGVVGNISADFIPAEPDRSFFKEATVGFPDRPMFAVSNLDNWWSFFSSYDPQRDRHTFWRLLVRASPDLVKDNVDLVKVLDDWQNCRQKLPLCEHNDHNNFIDVQATIYMDQTRLFSTETGLIGTGHCHTQQGDVAAFIAGCQWPVILRPVTGPQRTSGHPRTRSRLTAYQLIGPCYINDLSILQYAMSDFDQTVRLV